MHAARDEIGQQRNADGRVFRRSPRTDRGRAFLPVRRSRGPSTQVLVNMNSVDHHSTKRQSPEVAAHHLGQLLAGGDDEATAHRAIARASRRNVRGRRFDRPRVVSRRYAEHHLFDGSWRQRIRDREAFPRWQRDPPCSIELGAVRLRRDDRPSGAVRLQSPPASPFDRRCARTGDRTTSRGPPRASLPKRSYRLARRPCAASTGRPPSRRKPAVENFPLGLLLFFWHCSSWRFSSFPTPRIRSGRVNRHSNFSARG